MSFKASDFCRRSLSVRNQPLKKTKKFTEAIQQVVGRYWLSQMVLTPLANKYIWWKTPDEALTMPQRIVAQVMNIGDYTDVQWLVARVDVTMLRAVLARAEAGQFNARSWDYWHYRLGLSDSGNVPPLPVRKCE